MADIKVSSLIPVVHEHFRCRLHTDLVVISLFYKILCNQILIVIIVIFCRMMDIKQTNPIVCNTSMQLSPLIKYVPNKQNLIKNYFPFQMDYLLVVQLRRDGPYVIYTNHEPLCISEQFT